MGVKDVCLGNRFTILLSQNGHVYSFGENKCGQLGHGDTKNRFIPTIIKKLRKQAIGNISCGYDHVIARSTVGKAFVWGNG